MMMTKAQVSFESGIQSLTAVSTMKAKIVNVALTMKEAVSCSNVIIELGFEAEFDKAPLYIDNTAALHVVGNFTFSARTKNVALRYFYFGEKMATEGKIKIHHITTEQQLAEIGTKHLNKKRHLYLIDKINKFGS